ncbi:MAG: indole-3-glycerol phosphate synthase TrpC [Rhodothermales bacterium]
MTILDRIVEDTRSLVARRKQTVTVRSLEERPCTNAPTLSLEQALRRDTLAILAELKKASPSRGVIRADYDVTELAHQYKTGGAAAVSVLTEPTHFNGSLDHLAQVRQTIDLPLLRKDFIIDPYQLLEARAYGADAVLLIATVLDRSQLFDLHQAADELGLSCLVEIYDPSELDKIDFDQVTILGVNNRDLRTFEVDINRSLRVFEAVPEGVVRVSESGLRTAKDLAHLRRNGVDAVLIGETFMRATYPGQTLAAMKEDVYTLLRPESSSIRVAS